MADSTLKSNLTEAMKDAMRAKDKFRLGAIRLALAEIKRVEVDERVELDDERTARDLRAQALDQTAARGRRAAGGEEVVDQQHACTGGDRVTMHLERG